MNDSQFLNKLLKAQSITIRGLEIENKKLKKRVKKLLQDLNKKTVTKAKKAKGSFFKGQKAQIKIVKPTIQKKPAPTPKTTGPFSSWATKGYFAGAASALNRLSKTFNHLKGLIDELIMRGLFSQQRILQITWDLYAQFHRDRQVYINDEDYVDPELAEVLLDVFESALEQAKQGEQ